MTQQSYTVLARRYRPTRLSDLVGQEVLQKSLSEAILQNHLPHAILLHGTRGVGKTTTARIIARALNCVGPDGNGSPTPDPCGVCQSCIDIQNDRHLDVYEIDGASFTGVDNIKTIIESARYKAVKGRFKIFIIDEVHMLSKAAFNSLLKTLEEPPSHVKFIFATTELRKVPDTIISRCMHFDLQNMTPQVALSRLEYICKAEKINASTNALGMIARAGEGSMRDSLSLLDQAIALSLGDEEGITIECVEKMLGTTNRAHIFDIIEMLFKGQTPALIERSQKLFELGSEPLSLLQDILNSIYWLTCLKSHPALQQDITWSADDRKRGTEICETLSMISLARAWQVLSKGYEEVQRNPLQKQACIMVLVRLCHLGTLPSVEKVLETLSGFSNDNSGGNNNTNNGTSGQFTPHNPESQPPSTAAAAPSLSPSQPLPTKAVAEPIEESQAAIYPIPNTFKGLLKALERNGELLLAAQLTQEVRLVSYQIGTIALNIDAKHTGSLPVKLRKTLQQLTQRDWTLNISQSSQGTTLFEEQEQYKERLIEQAKTTPLLKEILSVFEGATLTMEKVHETI